jgi:hypothetical protein
MATQGQSWWSKYELADLVTTEGQPGSVRTLSFAGCDEATLAPDAAAIEAAQQRELAARPAATAAARRALYQRVDVPRFRLNDGHSIPDIGLGTWKAAPGEVRSAVHIALQAGYRHIDCASVYQNEEEVGDALDHVLQQGLVPRDELYICSKVW